MDQFLRGFYYWFLHIKELNCVVFIRAGVGLMPKQVRSNQSISDSLQPRFLKVSDPPSSVGFPVPQCGFIRRIWRRTSSECHLNPSNVYSTLFHVSQMSWKDASLGCGDQEGRCGVTWEWWSSWDLLDMWCVKSHLCHICFFLLYHLVSKHRYCKNYQAFCFSFFFWAFSFSLFMFLQFFSKHLFCILVFFLFCSYI